MINASDFVLSDGASKINFRRLFIRLFGHYKWFLLAWGIAFLVAYQINIRKEKIYALETSIAVKEESNPFFTSNTSLVFNWGGTSDQVSNITTTLKSRTHHEMVVDKLEFYINYWQQGKYHLTDVYGHCPFYFMADKNKPQVADHLIEITFESANNFVVKTEFVSDDVMGHVYQDNLKKKILIEPKIYQKKYRVGELIELPFLNGTIYLYPQKQLKTNVTYLLQFKSLDQTVESLRTMKVDTDAKAGSIINLSLVGKNKARLVDYLNTSVEVLIKRQLDRKNQFATNTINFIDSTLIAIDASLKDSEEDLKSFTKNKNISEIESSGLNTSSKILAYESERDLAKRKMAYYKNLTNYLSSSSLDFSELPAPTVVGIDDPNVVMNVSKLINLSNQKTELQYTRKNKLLFDELDNEMQSLKKTIQDNIGSAMQNVQYDLSLANSKINEFEGTMQKLPVQQQEYLKITRKYQLNDNIYTTFLSKRNEAEIVRAANLADIHFIDKAKDTGNGLVGPDTKINYILAFILGLLIPLIIILLVFFFDTSVLKIEDIEFQTTLPIIGIVGLKNTDDNLSVITKPKSALSESFRTIRTSIQFLLQKNDTNLGRVIMLSSSISGEGKTFCSINLASIYALSHKKTVLVGLDLRKPKIFGDFNLDNQTGVVNYIIGDKTLDEVIQKTSLENLDLIVSGPIPPNPSELLMSETLTELINELKKQYEYVILDTAPVGLVSDALSLSYLADVTLFVIRQSVTKIEMISNINNRVQRKELKNVSIVFNGFQNKAKYGYGYGNYNSYGYHEEEAEEKWYSNIFKILKKNKNN